MLMDVLESSWEKKGRLETSIWAAKLVLLCVGMVSSVVLFRVAIIPYSFNLVVSTLPSLWLVFTSLLSPPYIYLFLNFIIITIVASSSYHKHPQPDPVHVPDDHVLQPETAQDDPDPSSALGSVQTQDWSDIINTTTPQQVQSFTPEEEIENESVPAVEPPRGSDRSILATGNRVTIDRPDPVTRKGDPGEKAEEEFEEEVEESLDSMWKAITEANGKPVKPELKKSGTWNVRMSRAAGGGGDWAKKELRKWDTFSNPVIRERSMNQDELNQRVEAFIKKFNNDMRLERQDSDQRYVEMVNRSVY